MSKFTNEEKIYHDTVADDYAKTRYGDFIWEIPERWFILQPQYFIGKKVIDMGCGPAVSVKKAFGNDFAKRVSYTGIDISKKMIDEAKKTIPGALFRVHGFSGLGIKKSSMDTVMALGALHHAEDQDDTLREWCDMVKPGGYLLMREPMYFALRRGTGASPNEEGIQIPAVDSILNQKHFTVYVKLFFCSKFLHIVNRINNKCIPTFWKRYGFLWNVPYVIDMLFCNTLGYVLPWFRGEAVIIIAKKL
jgi:SAM-dependent methyltransferase